MLNFLRYCGNLVCLMFNIIVLNNNGAFSSFTNLHDKNISLNKKKYIFSGKYIAKCNNVKYLEIVHKIKKLDIFAYKIDDINCKTIVHKKNILVEQDDLITITNALIGDTLYTTSYERVAVLEETNNSLILCMTTCSENIINGYYRFVLKYDEDEQEIHLNYSKIQSFTTFLLRFFINLNETSYIESNNTSIMNTINHLFQDKIFTIDNVEYFYK